MGLPRCHSSPSIPLKNTVIARAGARRSWQGALLNWQRGKDERREKNLVPIGYGGFSRVCWEPQTCYERGSWWSHGKNQLRLGSQKLGTMRHLVVWELLWVSCWRVEWSLSMREWRHLRGLHRESARQRCSILPGKHHSQHYLGIGPDLDSLKAHVGALRVRNIKIICYLKTPSLSSCKQIREAMNAFIEKENIKLVPQGTTPFVTEEKPVWRQQHQRTFGKALGLAEQLATMKAKYITSEWYPFYQVYVHESESAPPIPLLTTTPGVSVATTEGPELLEITADKLVMACRRCTL